MAAGLVMVVIIGCCATTGVKATAPIPETGRADPRLESFDRLMRSFLTDNQVPGAALAVTRGGKLVYARGFGWADVEQHQPVQPDSLFRIASISKPLTAVAVLQLAQQHRFQLDDPAFKLVKLEPLPVPGRQPDARLRDVTVLDLLRHRGGWDRDQSFDPMFRSIDIAHAFGTPPPADPKQIIRYMLSQPLQFQSGKRFAYSNFGYCVLGRLIEATSGKRYDSYLIDSVLAPLHVNDMRLARTLASERAPREVRYYVRGDPKATSVFAADRGQDVPVQYGAWCIESMDAHGGWLASAIDLVRFCSSFDSPGDGALLDAAHARIMFQRPAGENPKEPVFYACGWQVRQVGGGRFNAWHTGLLDGTSTIMVRRHDGTDWAVLFNTDRSQDGQVLSNKIDPLVHAAADAVKSWPTQDLLGSDGR